MKNRVLKSLIAVFLSLFSFNSSVYCMEKNKLNFELIYSQPPPPKIDSSEKTSGQAFDYKYGNLNILIINGLDDDSKSKDLMSLLCHNEFGKKLSQIPIEEKTCYNEGEVYELVNQPKVRVAYFNAKSFIGNNFSSRYNANFIAYNTNVVLYIFGKNNTSDEFDLLKKFYHTFNRFWCGKYYDYDNEKQYSDGNVDDRTFWFLTALKAMGRTSVNHRYILFLFYGTNKEYDEYFACNKKCVLGKNSFCTSHDKNCKHWIATYVSSMPDARSIYSDIFYKDSNINKLTDLILCRREYYASYDQYEPFTNPKFNYKYNIWPRTATSGTGLDPKEKSLKPSIIKASIAVAALLGIGGIG